MVNNPDATGGDRSGFATGGVVKHSEQLPANQGTEVGGDADSGGVKREVVIPPSVASHIARNRRERGFVAGGDAQKKE